MNWKHVLNANNIPGIRDHIGAASKVRDTGYKFFLFGDTVYFLDDNRPGAMNTGLTIDDLI